MEDGWKTIRRNSWEKILQNTTSRTLQHLERKTNICLSVGENTKPTLSMEKNKYMEGKGAKSIFCTYRVRHGRGRHGSFQTSLH